MNSALLYKQHFLKNCFSLRCIQFSSLILNFKPRRKFCTDNKDSQNPLLNIDKLPSYNRISGEVVTDAIPLLVHQVETQFTELERKIEKKQNVSWEDIIPSSELVFDKLGLAWSAVSHLHGVRNNPALRNAYQKVQPDIVALTNRISQSKPVFIALKHLDSEDTSLDEAQKRILTSSLRSARNSGVHLEGEEKNEFNKVAQELAELSTNFMNNVLDSTKAFSHLLYNKKDTEGLPNSLITLMASSASHELNETVDPEIGPWKLSLDIPCFGPFMKHSLNSGLREKIYLAYISRASSADTDNSGIIEQIRELRKKQSSILGFKYYSTLSLDSKMAKSATAVWQMLEDLKQKAKPVAEQELLTLRDFASKHGHSSELKHWDLAFWSERQKEVLLNLNEEKLRGYFPFPRVLDGLFSLAQELFGIIIKESDKGAVETWHEDVKFFNIYDINGTQIASFFLDPYSRPVEKQGGAWMDSALSKDDALGRKPIAYLVCNQSPPIGDVPSLMTFQEVLTLFHEFGHGLQHMLTTVKYPSATGINNVEWDAVELPSQFMENWLYDWSTMQKISSHYKSGENLPDELFQQLQKGKTYQAGMDILRQLYLSALDMELHTSDDDWRTVMKRIAAEYTLLKPLKEDHLPCAFMHIFGGGYAAGYYSYKWAEVLSADAFSAFDEVGLDNRDKITLLGKRFRDTILAQGGARHPEQVFIDFRGRKPTTDALLKSYGLQ